MLEKQELYCHDCGNYVQFDIDIEMNGNHILKCPKCGHEHCRVVKDGVITSDRWDSRNPNDAIYATNITYTNVSTFTTYNISTDNTQITAFDQTQTATTNSFTYQSWTNAGQNGTNGNFYGGTTIINNW